MLSLTRVHIKRLMRFIFLFFLAFSPFAFGHNPFISGLECTHYLNEKVDVSIIRKTVNDGAVRFGEDLIASLRSKRGAKVKMSLPNGVWITNPKEPFHCSICVYASDRLVENLKEIFPTLNWQRVTTLYPFQGIYLHDYVIAQNFLENSPLIIDPTIRQFFFLKFKSGEISKGQFHKIPRIFVGSRNELIHLFQSFGIINWRLYFETEIASPQTPLPEL